MHRLGASPFWLDTAPHGAGWAVYRVESDQAGPPATTRVGGDFASIRHVLEAARWLALPEDAAAALSELVDVLEAGERALREVPVVGGG